MELVVDTNILFSYFWKESFTRKILLCQDIRLYAPEFALAEIQNYKHDIMKKTGVNEQEFKSAVTDIAISVIFLPVEDYSSFLKRALGISPDPNDIDFFALCLKLNLPLWSNDVLLKRQKKVPVFTTKDLFEKFFEILFPV